MTLELDGIRVRRGARTVLDDVSCRFGAGRLTAVIGPNGAGKSSLLQVAAGLLAPDAGAVRLSGAPLATIDRHTLARRRAYLPQRAGVDWPISVEAMVELGLVSMRDQAARRMAIDRTLADFDLESLRDRAATRLSGGELARASLARASVGCPELLIVDEPTAGLDPRHALDAAAHLRRVAEHGAAVVLAVHDLDLALGAAHDAVAIKDGRVIASGAVDAVLTGPVLGELFELPVEVREGFVRFGRP